LGKYYSGELEIIYRIDLVENNELFVSYKNCLPLQIECIGNDLFLSKADKFEFIRDRDGQVIGFDRCGNRVRRIRFNKL
jgi:hypothetical protein